MAEVDLTRQILMDLIALPTVNPMGGEYWGEMPVERPVVEYLERLFAPMDVDLQRQRCSARHESLLVSVPGLEDGPGTLFESHIDTVPADSWIDRAFAPRFDGAKVYGLGACDDKASLASMSLALLELLQSGRRPPQPVYLLAAGDEEYGQTGIRRFLDGTQPEIGRAVFGEPTGLVPVIEHKGTIRWDITVKGQSAHTSTPQHGHNAIYDAVIVIDALREHERRLNVVHSGCLSGAPTISVTMINGGQTRNTVPDSCTIAVDFRTPPQLDKEEGIAELLEHLDKLDVQLEHSELQCFAPALHTDEYTPFVGQVAKACQSATKQPVTAIGVPYGSDAGWMSDRIPTVVLGPGDIAEAHAVDEGCDLEEVVECTEIYRELLTYDWSLPYSED